MVSIISNFVYYSLVVLGVIFLFVSILAPRKLMFPNPQRFIIINEQGYIRSQRKLFSTIGICYILLGGLLILKILSLNIGGVFVAILPLPLMIFNDKISKKYLRKSDL